MSFTIEKRAELSSRVIIILRRSFDVAAAASFIFIAPIKTHTSAKSEYPPLREQVYNGSAIAKEKESAMIFQKRIARDAKIYGSISSAEIFVICGSGWIWRGGFYSAVRKRFCTYRQIRFTEMLDAEVRLRFMGGRLIAGYLLVEWSMRAFLTVCEKNSNAG